MMRKLSLIFTLFLSLGLAGCEQVDILSSKKKLPDTKLVARATEIVQNGLADEDPLVRTHAIEVAAEAKSAELMYNVAKLLNDKVGLVRFAATMAVGDSRYVPARDAVQKLLNDSDENVKIAAAYAMSRFGQGNYDDFFKKAIKSKNQTFRANACLVLGKLGERKWLPLLYGVISAADSENKALYQAAEAIAMIGDGQIYPKLWTMLISAYADVRIMGIRAMGKLGTTEAKNALITLLDDEVPEVRLVASGQLGVLGDDIGESVVLEFLRNRPAYLDEQGIERTNVLVVLAIGQIGTEELTLFLPDFLANKSESVRLAAAMAVFKTVKQPI